MAEKGYRAIGTTLKFVEHDLFTSKLKEAGFIGVAGQGSLHAFCKAVVEGRFTFTSKLILNESERENLRKLHQRLDGSRNKTQASIIEKILAF